jgi:SAM-dependent methyltransferase
MPPLELRRLVGPTDPADFDNPTGQPIYARFGLPPEAYEAVFDFGCGCGRLARQLLQQTPRPRRYVGIDAHGGMVEWCRRHLSSIDPAFTFAHHDVYSPGYAPGNRLRLAEPFPAPAGRFSLVIAHSVFTHLSLRQAEYYLAETARILERRGVAFTSWFFFDRDSFPFLPDRPFCLYTSEAYFDEAVIYDRAWFLGAVRRLGLAVRSTRPPAVAGHQWEVLLEKRGPGSVDRFPLGEDGAEWLCGASARPTASPRRPPPGTGEGPARPSAAPPEPPPLLGALAELDAMRRSWSWRVGRAVTAPARTLTRAWRR